MTTRSPSHPRRAALFALGCRLNQAEIALLADQLRAVGFEIVPWSAPTAELRVFNSCAVTATAAAKTRNLVRRLRREDPGSYIVLTGCDATLTGDAWREEGTPDLVVANADKHNWLHQLPPHLHPASADSATVAECADDSGDAALFTLPGQAIRVNRTRVNLKIQEGCNVHCSYCVIPLARGAPRSRAFADVLREVRTQLEHGAREFILSGINSGLYHDHGRRLPELLAALAALPGDFRIRIGSLEPGPTLPDVLTVMAAHPKRICPHLHIPLQYAEDRILGLMRRPYNFATFAELAHAAVAQVPGLCLGTDLIIGFPGETTEAFATCLANLQTLPLAYLHAFSFSPRPGTVAAELPGRVPGPLCAERIRQTETLGGILAERFTERLLGQPVQVLTETRDAQGRWHGTSGEFLEVTVTDAPATVVRNQFLTVRVDTKLSARAVRGSCGQSRSAPGS